MPETVCLRSGTMSLSIVADRIHEKWQTEQNSVHVLITKRKSLLNRNNPESTQPNSMRVGPSVAPVSVSHLDRGRVSSGLHDHAAWR
jgi:hypothetical protein